MRLLLEMDGKAACSVAIARAAVLGTDPDADVVVLARGVAPRQLRLLRKGAQWLAEPLAGTAAVWCNGARLAGPAPLSDGDRLVLGEARLRIRLEERRPFQWHCPRRVGMAAAAALLLAGVALAAGLARAAAAPVRAPGSDAGGPGAPPVDSAEAVARCEPRACAESVARLRAQARRLEKEREVAPRNAFDGWLALRRAQAFASAPGVDPAAGEGLAEELEEASAVLSARCSALRFSVHRSLELGEIRKARGAWERLAASFPGPEHPCHEEAGRLRASIEAGRGER